MVRFENVGLRYGMGPEILKDLSFTIAPQSFQFLTGPSGAGKTTLLRLILLSLKPTRGLISLFGSDVSQIAPDALTAVRRRMGVVFQDFRLLDHMSTFDNVALPLRIAGVGESLVQRNVKELLDWVGLADFMNAQPAVLSGGQKQRVAIARAVVGRPKLILADEPTGNVDDVIALRLMQLFVELHKLGASVIIATHNEALVARFPFQRLHIDAGKVAVLPPLDAAAPTTAASA